MVTAILEILVKEELCELGFDIPRDKITAQHAVMLNKTKEELPSTSDVAKADDIELQEIIGNAVRISLCNSRVNPLRICPCTNS